MHYSAVHSFKKITEQTCTASLFSSIIFEGHIIQAFKTISQEAQRVQKNKMVDIPKILPRLAVRDDESPY